MTPEPRRGTAQADVPLQQVAIVGAGPAGLIAFATLRFAGLGTDQITVLDERAPLAAWGELTRAINQRSMRSESDGHFFPTDYPGFALLDAVRHRSIVPLVRSAVNRYHPSCGDIQNQGRALAEHFGLSRSLRPRPVARVAIADEPEPHLVLLDEASEPIVRARHTLLALGHGPLRWPDALADGDARSRLAGRVFHAYEPKTYASHRVLVVGSGMAAATEWVNALEAGGTVYSVRRNPAAVHQALSAPRCWFSRPWLDGYHALDRPGRAAVLSGLAHGTYPQRAAWEDTLGKAAAVGRYSEIVGHILSVESDGEELVVRIRSEDGEHVIQVDRLVAATGFVPGWQAHPVLQRLVQDGLLEVEGSLSVLTDDCCVPSVTETGRTLALSGATASWAFPPADSFAGMKFAARRFSERAMARSVSGPSRLAAWTRMVTARPVVQRPAGEICASP